LLADALEIATDLGMPPLRLRVEELMSRIEGAQATAYPKGLTQLEVEVLRLVAGGRTDREIAEEVNRGTGTFEMSSDLAGAVCDRDSEIVDQTHKS